MEWPAHLTIVGGGGVSRENSNFSKKGKNRNFGKNPKFL